MDAMWATTVTAQDGRFHPAVLTIGGSPRYWAVTFHLEDDAQAYAQARLDEIEAFAAAVLDNTKELGS